jgi:starch phosphorylase
MAGRSNPPPATRPTAQRDTEEARTLYELLQDQVIPSYYRTGPMGYSPEWVAMSKRSIATIRRASTSSAWLANTSKNSTPRPPRTVDAISRQFRHRAHVADWKNKVRAAWPGVRLHRLDSPNQTPAVWRFGHIEVAVQLNGLNPEDVTVEALFGRPRRKAAPIARRHYPLLCSGSTNNGEALYTWN